MSGAGSAPAPPSLRADASGDAGDAVRVFVGDAASFLAGHPAGAVHVPLADLEQRLFELPPAGASVLVSGAGAADGVALLARFGYPAREDTSEEAETGPSAARLWSPSAALAACADRLEAAWAPAAAAVAPAAPVPAALAAADAEGAASLAALLAADGPLAVDVGCGHGRDAVFLAARGWRVLALDEQDRLVRKLRAFAAREGVAARVAGLRVDVEAAAPVAALTALLAQRVQLVLCVRFLHRPLLPAMRAWVRPGGAALHTTFARGPAPYARGPHRARFLLEPGELRAVWTTGAYDGEPAPGLEAEPQRWAQAHGAAWEVWRDAADELPDGRWLHTVLVRRPV
jgi:SAM-dependent methyltransferase